MSRCAGCSTRLARGASFCPVCGRSAQTGPPALLIETDDGEPDEAGREVVLAPTRRSSQRWVAGALVVAIAAVVGVSVTSGGDDGKVASVTTRATPRTTRAARPATTSAAAEATAPASSTTTAKLPGLGPGPLLGEQTGLGLLVWSADGVYRVDLDASKLERTALRSADGDPDRTSIGLVLQSVEQGTRRLLAPGAARAATVSAESGTFLGEGPPGRLWFLDYASDEVRSEAIWYRDGTANRIDVPLPADVQMAVPDGLGGLVLQAPGSVFVMAAPDATPRRLAYGTLIWAGDGHALVAECSDELRCAPTVYDLRDGSSRNTPRGFVGGAFAFSALSPDGTHLFAVDAVGGGTELTAVGVGGGITRLGPIRTPCFSPSCNSAVVWSPDGRWLFWVSGDGDVSAWRVGLADPIVLSLAGRTSPRDQAALSGALVVDTMDRLRAFP